VKELKEQVLKLSEEEARRSMLKHPLFNSTHEGYAVIKEEIEEAEQELNDVNAQLQRSWYFIKHNEDADKDMLRLKEYAVNLAAEAIQVAAMAQKFIDSAEEDKTNE
jgi:hypothetical protein